MFVSGCVIEPIGQPVAVAAPEPVVEAPVMVPDYYVWDGFEYVGLVGNQYYYLGPGRVWVVCEPFRLERFHGWERYHADWRTHAIHNEHFRNDRNGHYQPRPGQPRQGEPRKAPQKKRKDEK